MYVSLERNMHCAVGFCGHCQFGPSFVCMDGPVFRYDRIRTFFNLREA
jgi:NAD(P)H-flavin reductase